MIVRKKSVTFRNLDGDVSLNASASSLDEWYVSIRDTELSGLRDSDLARACRQQLFLEEVIPEVIERLNVNPLAGDIYEGELMLSIKPVPKGFWLDHHDCAEKMRKLVFEFKELRLDDDFREDFESIKQSISG